MSEAIQKKRVFLALEGGGAKGIVHVGALRALEEINVEIAGVAGTSMGAIVGALVAAGYDSHDLIDEDGGSPLLRQMGFDRAPELFGDRWRCLALARWGWTNKLYALVILLCLCTGVSFGVANVLGASTGFALLLVHLAIDLLAILIVYRLAGGLVNLDLLVSKLEEALAAKLNVAEGEAVLFRHFDAIGRPLRIIATDLAGRRLTIFSTLTTPDTPVAHAIAASAALPLGCESRTVDGRTYVDGGIVSNLPAWTFDEERALDPDAVTIAISIVEPSSIGTADGQGPLGMFTAILHAAMFGRRHLEVRAAPRLLAVPVPTHIATLDFDMGPSKAKEAVADAQKHATADITYRLLALPAQFEANCSTLRTIVDKLPNAANLAGRTYRTRVLVALRDPGASASWRIQFGCGLAPTDTDDQLLLPDSSSTVGLAATRKATIVARVPLERPGDLGRPSDRYRKALVRPDLKWCVAIPIFDEANGEDQPPIAVVAIDSDLDVEYAGLDEAVVQVLEERATELIGPLAQDAIRARQIG